MFYFPRKSCDHEYKCLNCDLLTSRYNNKCHHCHAVITESIRKEIESNYKENMTKEIPNVLIIFGVLFVFIVWLISFPSILMVFFVFSVFLVWFISLVLKL